MIYYCPLIDFEFEDGLTPEKNCVHYKDGCTFYRGNGKCVAILKPEVRDEVSRNGR